MSGLGVFKSVIGTVDTDVSTVYTSPSETTSYLIQCDVACISNTGVQVSVKLVKSGSSWNGAASAHLVKNVPIPVGSTLQILDGQKVVLEPGDSIQVKCETEGESVDVIISLVEDVNL